MERNTQQPQIGIGVFVEWDGKICLGKRKNAHGAGEWSLPGGHLEFCESVTFGAQREVREETGITIGNFSTVPISFTENLFNHDGERLHYITIFVWSSWVSGSVDEEEMLKEPDKCERWKWFTGDELRSLDEPVFAPLKDFFNNIVDMRRDIFKGFDHLHRFLMPEIRISSR